jgi:hypothetical protein
LAAEPVVITVPSGYNPRSYQIPLMAAWDAGCKRGVLVWHRRSGKDRTALGLTVREMCRRVGVYYHIFPELQQGRKVLWNGIGRDGTKFLDTFPGELVARVREDEMSVTLKNGSIWQIVGGDRIDAVVGTNPVGLVYSEYSLMSPRGWEFFRPIIRENGGWALFIYTPRGNNHGEDLYDMARSNREWYTSLLTVRDTFRDSQGEDGSRVVTDLDVEADRREGMPDELVDQEYFCSFTAALVGSYYGDLMKKALAEGRISNDIRHDPNLPVYTFWDLGLADATAIWFVQVPQSGRGVRCIDYYEMSNVGLDQHIKAVKEKPYVYGTHFGPADINNREYTTAITRARFAEQHGIRFTSVPMIHGEKGWLRECIDSTRRVLPMVEFAADKCRMGIDALRSYRKEWDDRLRVYRDKPLHDWSSHAATAFHLIAMGLGQARIGAPPRATHAEMSFDAMNYDRPPRRPSRHYLAEE